MNFLKVVTRKNLAYRDKFDIHWTNTIMSQRGMIRIAVSANNPDAPIIAELHALQYLLEVKEVIGRNSSGNANLPLFVSQGAIRKLARKVSTKSHLNGYAKFLTTRFKDSPIAVDKNDAWTMDVPPEIELDAAQPLPECVYLHGMGQVELTAHVVERFAEHMQISSVSNAWRKLRALALDPEVIEVNKYNSVTRLRYAIQGREEGRYFLHQKRQVIMVITKNPDGTLIMVTAYPAQGNFYATGNGKQNYQPFMPTGF